MREHQFDFGTKRSQVQILSPRPSPGSSKRRTGFSVIHNSSEICRFLWMFRRFCKLRAAKYPELTSEKRAQNESHPFWFSLLGMLYIAFDSRPCFSALRGLLRAASFSRLHKSKLQRRPRFRRVRVPGIDVAACNLAHLRRQFRRCAISLQDRSSISSVRDRSTFRPCLLSSRSFMKQG